MPEKDPGEVCAHRCGGRQDAARIFGCGMDVSTGVRESGSNGMLNAITGEDFQAPIVELDGYVDGDFLRRGTQHFA